jgi:hypothetical protein
VRRRLPSSSTLGTMTNDNNAVIHPPGRKLKEPRQQQQQQQQHEGAAAAARGPSFLTGGESRRGRVRDGGPRQKGRRRDGRSEPIRSDPIRCVRTDGSSAPIGESAPSRTADYPSAVLVGCSMCVRVRPGRAGRSGAPAGRARAGSGLRRSGRQGLVLNRGRLSIPSVKRAVRTGAATGRVCVH